MIWNTHTNPQTHTLTHMLLWDKHALTLTYVPGESNILPTNNGRKKKVKRREEERNSRRGDHRSGAQPRERKKKPGEFFGIKQCFLYQQRQGPAWERGQAGSLRPEAPRLRPPLTLLSSPLSLFFPTHLTCSTSPLLFPKKGHSWTLFKFLWFRVPTASNVFDSHSFNNRCKTLLCSCLHLRCFSIVVLVHCVGLWSFSHSYRKLLRI